MIVNLKRSYGLKIYQWMLLCSCLKMVQLSAHNSTFQNRTSARNNTSIERSVSVSFDNTKIYFFGDKIEFAGEVHNRYPDKTGNSGNSGPSGSLEADDDKHILKKWGTPVPPGLRPWRPMPRVHYIDAECQNDNMKITILFNGSFTGLIYSSKYAYNPDCLYVNGTGSQRYEFYIQLNRCGTLGGGPKGRNEDDKKMMWNTLTVQYNPLIEEEFDEHFRVTCEYGYQFWKKVSFPVVNVKVPTESPLLFTLSPPECQMEIRTGFNLNGQKVSGPVNVGDPLTLVIYMRSPTVGFDIIINNCVAHNGASKRMSLIDDSGCPLENKIISDFKGVDLHHAVYESKVYAYFKAFRFTGSPALYIECDVRMCHGICPKQRCYWRNLRDKDKDDEDYVGTGSIPDYHNNQTSKSNRNVNVTKSSDNSNTRQHIQKVYWNITSSNSTNSRNSTATTKSPQTTSRKSPQTTPPKSTTAIPISSTSPSTRTSASSTVRNLSVAPTGKSTFLPTKSTPAIANTVSSTTSTRKPALTTTVRLGATTASASTTTKVKANMHPSKSELTSTVNLNIKHRRIKRKSGEQSQANSKPNNTISETLNLFQALEVRSEPIGDIEEYAGFRGNEGSIVCIKTVGFTAIISAFMLILILVVSICFLLCARLRRLKDLHVKMGMDKCYNSKDILAAIKVHRTS